MVTGLLYFLSYTDRELIARCDVRSKIEQKVKGALVLIVSLLATFSAIEAMTFVTQSRFLIVVSGIACGSVCMLCDRYIVSVTTTAYVVLIGVVFAIILGVITSEPLQLRLFEARIDVEISSSQMTDEREMRIKELENEITRSRNKLEELQEQLIAEAVGRFESGRTGRYGVGPVYNQKLKVYQDFKSQTEQRIAQLTMDIESVRNEESVASINQSKDYLSRVEALRKIEKTSASAFRLIWAIRFMLILTYALPFVLTLLAGNTEYSVLVRRQRFKLAGHEFENRVSPIQDSRLRIPGFGYGFAAAIDWAGMLAPTVQELRGGDRTPNEADAAALAGDWRAVGDDLKKVLRRHGAKATSQVA